MSHVSMKLEFSDETNDFQRCQTIFDNIYVEGAQLLGPNEFGNTHKIVMYIFNA